MSTPLTEADKDGAALALCSGGLLAALAARWERRAIHLETHVNYAPGGYPLRMARASLLRDCAKELRAEIDKAANNELRGRRGE